jgi:glycine cleavage system regulatory protein
MATFTLVCVGDDRPGLVSDLSAPISAHGASWERSQMARLAGKFAGVLLLEVADDRADALVADLTALKDVGLQVTLERTDEPAGHPSVRLSLELIGADHPGIVAEISAALAAQGIGIEELSSDVRDAPMAGGTLFEAHAVLEAPPSTSMDVLRSKLEALADELMVEIRLSDADDENTS